MEKAWWRLSYNKNSDKTKKWKKSKITWTDHGQCQIMNKARPMLSENKNTDNFKKLKTKLRSDNGLC